MKTNKPQWAKTNKKTLNTLIKVEDNQYTLFDEIGEVEVCKGKRSFPLVLSMGYYQECSKQEAKEFLRNIHEKLLKQKEDISSSLKEISKNIDELIEINDNQDKFLVATMNMALAMRAVVKSIEERFQESKDKPSTECPSAKPAVTNEDMEKP